MTEENTNQTPKRRFSSSRTLSLGEPPINHNCLQEHPFFKERDPRLFKLLLENVSLKVFHPGATMVKEGAEADCIYFLHRGEVEVLIGPEEKRVAKLGHGSLFGEMALLGTGKRSATVRAVTFCVCRSIDAHVFRACSQRFPTEKIYFAKLAAERLAARKALDVYVHDEAIAKLRKSVHALRFVLRMQAMCRSSPPLSAADSPGQEEKPLYPCMSSAATHTGFAEDVSEASGANVSQDAMRAEVPPHPKKRSSITPPKRKFMSNQESSSCHGSERSPDDVDRLSHGKHRSESEAQSTDCPDDLSMITCSVASQSTDCPDDKRMIEPSERLSRAALSRIQFTTSRFMDPRRQEVQESTPVANSNIVNPPKTVPVNMKLNSTSCQEASDQDLVGKPGNYDAMDRHVGSGQGDALSNRFDPAKSRLPLIAKRKHKSASCKDSPDPSRFAKPILVHAVHCERIPEDVGSWLTRRSLPCSAAKSGSPSYRPQLKTKQRAIATWWRT